MTPGSDLKLGLTLRHATGADAAGITSLIAVSSWGLLRPWYSDEQLRAAIGTVFGLDRDLILDGTYFVAEADGQMVGCGGWGARDRLFGASSAAEAPLRALDPEREPARIRAFFIHPDWARRGIGHLILSKCEDEARSRGFRSVTLMATLGGVEFYRRAGYIQQDPVRHDLGSGLLIDFVRMSKALE